MHVRSSAEALRNGSLLTTGTCLYDEKVLRLDIQPLTLNHSN